LHTTEVACLLAQRKVAGKVSAGFADTLDKGGKKMGWILLVALIATYAFIIEENIRTNA
jgi:hypothetical protein